MFTAFSQIKLSMHFSGNMCYRYTFDDPELKSIIKHDDDVVEIAGSGILEDLVPGLKYVYETGKMKKFKAITKVIVEDYLTRKFLEHKETFNKGILRTERLLY